MRIFFFIFTFLITCFHSLWAQLEWSSPITISDAGFNSETPQIAMDKSGNAVCVWRQQDGANYNILASHTTDYGASWSSPQIISQTGVNNRTPQIAIDDLGHATAVWRSGNTVQTASSSDYGASWSSTQTLSAGFALDPEVAINPLGNAIIIWREISGSVRIKVSYSSDFGATWSPGMFISTSASFSPQIVLDSTGNAIAVWQQSGAFSTIVRAYSSNYGVTWSSISTISEATNNSEFPQITLDESGNSVAIWRQQTNDSVQTAYSSDYGVSWSSVQTLSNIGETVQDPRIAMNSSGNVIALWRQLNSFPNYDIQASYSSDYGATWSSPSAVSDTGESAIRPRIAINDTLAIAVFQQSIEASGGIISTDSSDFGATWSSLDTLSDPEYFAIIPDISMDSSGNAIVVWSRSDGSNTRIQIAFERSLPISPTIFGSKKEELFPLRIDLQNIITCDPISDPGTYKLYDNSALNSPIESVSTTNTIVYFVEHLQKKGVSKTYYVTWTNELGEESEPSSVTIKR